MAEFQDSITQNEKLFARIDALHQKRDTLGLDPEALRVLERYHLDFVRSGARLTDAEREPLVPLNRRYPIAEVLDALSQRRVEEDGAVEAAVATRPERPPRVIDHSSADATSASSLILSL